MNDNFFTAKHNLKLHFRMWAILLFVIWHSSLYAATINKVKIRGKNFLNEEEFSRRLKSEYDIIQRRWTFIDDKTIDLDAYHLNDHPSPMPALFEFEGEHSKHHYLTSENVKYINFGVPLAFAAYGAFFWDWGKISGFNFRDEGWFAKSTYAGGTDKIAHFYSHYTLDRFSYYMYRQSGLSREDALKHSFILATSVGLLIEIGDGISHYGFAINDLISDMAGIGLGHLLNQNAYLDELLGVQLWWWSDDTATGEHKKGGKLKDPIDDYNNQKYVLNLRLAAIPVLRDFTPTRYLNLDLGYYTRGFKDSPEGTKTLKQVYTGVSINVSQVLRDFFPKSDAAYAVSTFSRFYQFPYTSLDIKKWKEK
ncbi:MAG: DUF2279 domain-containing protein [Bacteriovorax sp.]|jgi:hypothetical protein